MFIWKFKTRLMWRWTKSTKAKKPSCILIYIALPLLAKMDGGDHLQLLLLSMHPFKLVCLACIRTETFLLLLLVPKVHDMNVNNTIFSHIRRGKYGFCHASHFQYIDNNINCRSKGLLARKFSFASYELKIFNFYS